MAINGILASAAVAQVLNDTAGLPAFLAGSSAAAVQSGNEHAYTDVDIFVPKPGVYFALVTRLQERGWKIEGDRFSRMYERHLAMGFNGWHTNSMKLLNSDDTEVNVIYKKVDGHETTMLSQVIESFDFGLLGVGYETETSTFRDMRSYLFPGYDINGPLPMMEYRQETVGRGLMSQHIMLRTAGRYARYARYGYDMSLIKPLLVKGYYAYSTYKTNRTKPEDATLADIALGLAQYIELDQLDALETFEKTLPMTDGLDDIFARME